MSYFKSKGIVLKKTKYGEKEFLYSLFSYDFGKIDVLKKISTKEKTLDIGYDINFEVHSKKNSNISKIAHIKIIGEFDARKKDFETINDYLILLSKVQTRCEKSTPIYEIYELLHALLKGEVNREKILLAHIKLIQILGELPEKHPDEIVQKISKYMQNNASSNILRLTNIEEPQIQQLRKIIADH